MGLLRAGVGAAASVLSDQWRDYFYCDAIPSDVLVVKARSRSGGTDNIISDGSIIAVNEGQCMIVVQQGEIIEVCAEAGEFVFEGSSEPSIFYGDLGEAVKQTFERIGRRFSFGGGTANDMRVYYVNTKEIMGNKYGTPVPVPFRVVDTNIGLDTDIAVRCNGEYSYRIVNPILFYKNVCGNVTSTYTRSQIDSQLKSEFLTALQPGLGRISEMGIRYSSIPSHTLELAQAMQDTLSSSWTEKRGIAVVAVGMNSIATTPEDEERIKELQRIAVMRDPNMRAANYSMASSEALKTAAGNEAGAMMGFMGMNMAANAAGGMAMPNLYNTSQSYQPVQNYQTQQPAQPQQPAASADSWTCPSCGTANTGKFCGNCGTPKPASADNWICPNCGTANTGKFCGNCGTPKPAADGPWTCPDCGTSNTGKFCGGCGKPRP